MSNLFKKLKYIVENNDLLTQAQNPATNSDELDSIFYKTLFKNEPEHIEIKKALMKNPNTKMDKRLMLVAPDTEKDFFENPILPMEVLENPNLFADINTKAEKEGDYTNKNAMASLVASQHLPHELQPLFLGNTALEYRLSENPNLHPDVIKSLYKNTENETNYPANGYQKKHVLNNLFKNPNLPDEIINNSLKNYKDTSNYHDLVFMNPNKKITDYLDKNTKEIFNHFNPYNLDIALSNNNLYPSTIHKLYNLYQNTKAYDPDEDTNDFYEKIMNHPNTSSETLHLMTKHGFDLDNLHNKDYQRDIPTYLKDLLGHPKLHPKTLSYVIRLPKFDLSAARRIVKHPNATPAIKKKAQTILKTQGYGY